MIENVVRQTNKATLFAKGKKGFVWKKQHSVKYQTSGWKVFLNLCIWFYAFF